MPDRSLLDLYVDFLFAAISDLGGDMAKWGLSWRVGVALGVAAAGMALARWLHIPGGAIIGAMVLTATARLLNAPAEEPPSWLRTVARIILGLTIGATVTPDTIHAVTRALLPVSVMVVAMMALGLIVAWAVHRWAHMALPTALCGTAPGALAGMVTLADSLGGEGAVVASMHLVRLISVSLIVPSIVRDSFTAGGVALALPAATPDATDPLARLAILFVLGLIAGLWAARLKIPAGDLLAGMIVAALLNPGWLRLPALPDSWRLFAQWVVGAGVGATVTRETLRHFKPFALAGALMTAFLIVCGLGLGWLLTQISDLDLVTALVGCAPGGADTMMILAGELGADPQIVAAMHVSRMLILMVLLPVLIRAAANSRNSSRLERTDRDLERRRGEGYSPSQGQ